MSVIPFITIFTLPKLAETNGSPIIPHRSNEDYVNACCMNTQTTLWKTSVRGTLG